MIRTMPSSKGDSLRPIMKRLEAGRYVAADFYDENAMKQCRWRIVRLNRHAHGEVTIYGINPGETVRLHLSRVAFIYQ